MTGLAPLRAAPVLLALAACAQPTGSATGPAAPAVAAPSGAAVATASAEAALRTGVETCLREFRDLSAAPDLLRAQGFSVDPYVDQGVWEVGSGSVYGIVDTSGGTCMMQSPEVPRPAAEAMAAELMQRLFPDQYQPGRMEGSTQPCDGFVVFPGRGLITLTYTAAGNSGECEGPGSAIVLDISA